MDSTRFQLDAIEAVDKRVNVLVSAPTGSGKTLVANYAIGRELEREQRTFYTTPLKALSNQKYHELCELYGDGTRGPAHGRYVDESHRPGRGHDH